MKYFFYCKHYVSSLFFYIRMKLLQIILRHAFSKVEFAEAARALSSQGFYIFKNYYSQKECDALETLSDAVLDASAGLETNQINIERDPGEIKIKHLDEQEKGFKRFSSEFHLFIFSLFFCGRPTFPNVMLNIVHDGNFNHPAIPGRCTQPHNSRPHIDSHYRILKGIVALRNVDPENGPTAIVPHSSNLIEPMFRSYAKLDSDDPGMIDEETFNKIRAKYGIGFLVMQRGDFALIDTRNVHYASNFSSGIRKLVWLYF